MSLVDKFHALEKNEQSALKIAAVAIVFFVLYQFIYLPFQTSMDNLDNQLKYHSELNQWLRSVTPSLANIASQGNKKTINASQLLGTTSRSLKDSKLKPFAFDLQQSDASAIQLSFKKVPYTDFIGWMDEFWQSYSLTINYLNVGQLKTPGMVSVNLRFELQSAK
jgi:type II secretory pathway component PulM